MASIRAITLGKEIVKDVIEEAGKIVKTGKTKKAETLLEKKKIPYMFTLADNSLFYHELDGHHEQDPFLNTLYREIDFTKWFSFGERMMGFNQWALLNEYERGTTHPLDKAHADAVKLMQSKFKEIIGGTNV